MLRTLCLFIFMLFCIQVYAGKTPLPKPQAKVVIKPKAVLVTDTTTITPRQFDTTAINAYKKLPEFVYRENYDAGPSLWTRFWNWFWSLFDFKDKRVTNNFFVFLKYFFIVLGVAAITFLVLKLAGINVLNTFRRNPQVAKLAYAESEENIHEIDFDNEIEKAIAVHNYRLAVRMLYLKSLKQLSDKGLIDWQLNKTNTTYINELTDNNQREAFKQLTNQFEYVWYGDFAINGDVFKNISLLFNNFKGGTA
jgi:ABC-type dipeptide/oligopeptide/nickel transport system permease component